MNLERLLKVGTAATAVLAFGVSLVGRFLPQRYSESDYGLQLFVLREFRFELLTLGVAAVVVYVFWDLLAALLDRAWRGLRRLFAGPPGVYGAHARVASAIGVLLTAVVVAGGLTFVGQKLTTAGKVNYVYLRDIVADKYHRFLWREVRLAQAALDYTTATRVLEQIGRHFPQDAGAATELRFVKNVVATAERLERAGRESIDRYGVNPEGVGLLAEALALNPQVGDLRVRLERTLEEIASRADLVDRHDCSDDDPATESLAQSRRQPLSDRALAYLVEPGDRGQFRSRAAQQSLLRARCSQFEQDGDWMARTDLWREFELRELLDELQPERLAARSVDYRFGWTLLDREAAGKVLAAAPATTKLAGRSRQAAATGATLRFTATTVAPVVVP